MSTNVWDDLLQRASRESSVADMHLIVVGAPAAGKTALVQKLRSLVENRGDGRRGSESEGEDDGEEEEEEEGGRPNPSRAPSSTSASVDTGRACLRYTYFSNAKAEEAEASRSCVHAWLLSDPGKARLLACEPCLAPPSSPLVLLAVDLTDPWSIPASLEQWSSALLSSYAGVKPPVLVVGCKSDTIDKRPDRAGSSSSGGLSDRHIDLVLAYLRTFCSRNGFGLILTSANTGTNISTLLQYIQHNCDSARQAAAPPRNVVDRLSLFVPAGSDTEALIDVLLTGMPAEETKAGLRSPQLFLKMLPPQPAIVNLSTATKVVMDGLADEETWVRELAALSGVNSLSSSAGERSLDAMLDESTSRNTGLAGFASLGPAPPASAGRTDRGKSSGSSVPAAGAKAAGSTLTSPTKTAGSVTRTPSSGGTASAASGGPAANLETDPAKMKEFFKGLMEKSKPRKAATSAAPAGPPAPPPV